MDVLSQIKAKKGSIIGVAIGVLIGFQAGRTTTEQSIDEKRPYVGIDFDDRKNAEDLRRTGNLDTETLYGACKAAVDNFQIDGTSADGEKVFVLLPTREDLKRHPFIDKNITKTIDPK